MQDLIVSIKDLYPEDRGQPWTNWTQECVIFRFAFFKKTTLATVWRMDNRGGARVKVRSIPIN